LGFVAKEFHLSPDELFTLSMDRFLFYISWLTWQNNEINPKEVQKGFKEFEQDMGFTE
jgi:hypothetical protein